MKLALFTLMLGSISLFASAYSGEPAASDLRCAEAQAFYQAHDHIYVRINTGQMVPVYGLHKACEAGQQAEPYYVQTAGQESCFLGYRCR
jgi:hypothetical protein